MPLASRDLPAALRARARTWVMGIVNVTPDSFSDGGESATPEAAARRIDRILEDGADLVDVGGESTRPGHAVVPEEVELDRVVAPVAYAASERGALVSIDTTRPRVAEAALLAGARIVNDVSCLADDDLARVAARHGAALIVMHSRGSMATMGGFGATRDDAYGDVVGEVTEALSRAVERAVRAGVPRDLVFVDPGLGFHKSARHSWELLRRVDALQSVGPVVVGASRKSFLAGAGRGPKDRLGASLSAALWAAAKGAAMVRVHDVRETADAFRFHASIEGGG